MPDTLGEKEFSSKEILSGRISIKDTYTITPAERPRLKHKKEDEIENREKE